MSNGDFVCSSPNDGTHYFRPVTARAQTFWQKQNYNRFLTKVSCAINHIQFLF